MCRRTTFATFLWLFWAAVCSNVLPAAFMTRAVTPCRKNDSRPLCRPWRARLNISESSSSLGQRPVSYTGAPGGDAPGSYVPASRGAPLKGESGPVGSFGTTGTSWPGPAPRLARLGLLWLVSPRPISALCGAGAGTMTLGGATGILTCVSSSSWRGCCSLFAGSTGTCAIGTAIGGICMVWVSPGPTSTAASGLPTWCVKAVKAESNASITEGGSIVPRPAGSGLTVTLTTDDSSAPTVRMLCTSLGFFPPPPGGGCW